MINKIAESLEALYIYIYIYSYNLPKVELAYPTTQLYLLNQLKLSILQTKLLENKSLLIVLKKHTRLLTKKLVT